MARDIILSARSITKSYGELRVLPALDLDICEGEILSITGKSGAGKSTLLHLLSTLDRSDSGVITMRGEDITRLTGKALARFRNRHIGFVFQFHHLLQEFTAVENVSIPALIMGRDRIESEDKAAELLRALGLSQRLDHKPSQLSGGEQQRVAIARALINDPAIIYADEPTGNLDTQNSEELYQLFFQLRDEQQRTIVVVTHDRYLAERGDRLIELDDGIITRDLRL